MELSILNLDENELLSRYLKKLSLRKGDVLFEPGTKADTLFVLKTGRIGVRTKTGFEDKQQVIALLDPGAIIGERGIIGEGERGMTVFAIEDSSLLSLASSDFREIEKIHPKAAIEILKKLVSITTLRLQMSSDRLAHVL